ncbi:MAG: carbohydrate binding domain-containing protein [Armatimonadota bacterium]
MRRWIAGGLLLSLMGCLAAQQEPKSVIDFESEDHGWFVLPLADGKVERTSNPNDVKRGKYALMYTYTAAQGKLNAIIHLEPESWAQGFRFWIKTDRPTMLLFVVSEEGGERWQAPFWSGLNEWQQVTLALSDFTLMDDSQPQNGKLDMDRAEGIGFMDAGAFLFAVPEAALLFGEMRGTRMLWLDDFEFLSKAPPRKPSQDTLDDFQRDYLMWFATQGVRIKPEAGGMLVEYKQQFPWVLGVGRPLPKRILADTKGLVITLQVKNETTLAVVLEEEGGERWMASRSVGGEDKPETLRLEWSAFSLTDDTKGKGDGQLTPARVNLLALVDMGVITGDAQPVNRWIVRMVKLER